MVFFDETILKFKNGIKTFYLIADIKKQRYVKNIKEQIVECINSTGGWRENNQEQEEQCGQEDFEKIESIEDIQFFKVKEESEGKEVKTELYDDLQLSNLNLKDYDLIFFTIKKRKNIKNKPN